MKRIIIVLLTFALSSALAFAQNITVKGTVLDENNEPVIGASVKADPKTGTVTNIDGEFTLKNIKLGSRLTISYMGYVPKTVKAATQINVQLTPDQKALDELVVVGYGASKKSNISGAVSTVKADELPRAAQANIGAMLRGRCAGMDITASSATPGAALDISIRGGLSGQKPLIVIDGVPQLNTNTVSSGTSYSGGDKDNGLVNLNPDDIETINVLKDASAASIYGSDASGGVILITTKRGKVGKPQISYSGSVACQFISDAPDYMNAKDFMTQQNKVFDELGQGDKKFYTQSQIDNFVGNGTNWLKEVTRTGVVNEHNFSINGGSEKTKYLFSVSAYDVRGVAKNNSMNRITGRLNLDQEFNKYVKAGISTSYAQIKYNDVPLGDSRQDNSALIYSAMTFNPTVSVYDQNGDFSDNPCRPNIYPNPVSLLTITDQTTSKDLFLSGYIEYKPWKFLSIKATGGADIKDVQADQYIPTTTKKGKSMNGQASKQNSKNTQTLLNVIATYTQTFAKKHELSVMAGWEYKKQSWNGMGITANNFPTDGALMNNIGTSEQENPDIQSNKGSSEMASFIGRINYTLLQRYILTFNIRVDGSSNFSKKHQWGCFPGISAAWRVSEEKWLKNVTWLSNLKIRLGYGQTGNPGSLTGINTVYGVSRGTTVIDGSLVNGISLSKLGNPDLKWETLTDINLGIDFGFLHDRITGSIDFYDRTRSNVILSKKLGSYNEVQYIDYNSSAKYQSRGLEISLHTVNIKNKNFEWDTDINFSYYRNKTISRDADFIPAPYQSYQENWNNIYGYRTNGLVQPGESYAHLPKSTAGAINYLDLYSYQYDADGNKMRDAEGRYIRVAGADGTLDEADQVLLYNNTPMPFSINNTFRWKNWDFNFYLYGSLNGWKLNEVKYQSVYGITDLTYGVNALTSVKDRWSYENVSGTLPGVAEASSGIDPKNSDFFYEKAWYLRLDNVSLGYTFPDKWFKGYIHNLHAYIAGRNLCVFTPFGGMDPETGNGIGAYPNQKSVAFGLSVKF